MIDSPDANLQPNDNYPSEVRQQELIALADMNLTAGRPPYANARLLSYGELLWVMARQGWTGEASTEGESTRPNLVRVDLQGVNLAGASLHGANLELANLSLAILYQITLSCWRKVSRPPVIVGGGLEGDDERRIGLQGRTARQLGLFQRRQIREMGVEQRRVAVDPQPLGGL